MLQHSTTDFYDLSTGTARQTPPYSPSGGTTTISAINNNITSNNNNNHSSSNNNNLDVLQNGGSSAAGGREALPSFGFTQEQVACVCEVSLKNC